MKVTILGCGSAAGTPSVAGGWGKCDPSNLKNRRRRASILVEEGATQILVDTSPDLREQMLDAGLRRLDAVHYTHAHADHIHGIDELREINRLMGQPLPIFGTAETLAQIKERFGYVFEGIPPGRTIFRPWLLPNTVNETQPFSIGEIPIQAFVQDHGFSQTLGYRCGEIVYSTDVIRLPDAAKDVIRGAKVWIVGALSDQVYPTHANVAEVVKWIAELKPERAVVTHMTNALDFETLAAQLPPGVIPAYDGMCLEIPGQSIC